MLCDIIVAIVIVVILSVIKHRDRNVALKWCAHRPRHSICCAAYGGDNEVLPNNSNYREFKDVVFEDVVFDNNSCVTLLCIVVIVTSMSSI